MCIQTTPGSDCSNDNKIVGWRGGDLPLWQGYSLEGGLREGRGGSRGEGGGGD